MTAFGLLPLSRRPVRASQRGLALLGTLLLAAGAAVLLAVVGLLISLAVLYPQLPDTSSLNNYHPKQPLRVYTADGVEIAGFGQERRQYTPLNEIPKLMRDALLSVEDSRFYEHHGIDPIGVARAVVSNLTGGQRQGASTITQQVARTFFLTRERTISRKLKEAMLSVRIEHQLGKDRILELYMNQIYLGARSYGFAEASQTYFGKPLKDLSVAEVAMLAGLPQNPAYANPVRNPDRARVRQQVVLQRMLAENVITQAQYDAALKEKLVVRDPQDVEVHAEHVAEMVRQQVFAQYGESAYTSGMKVYTTLNSVKQRAAWAALRQTLIDREATLVWRGPEAKEDLDKDLADTDAAVADALQDHLDDEALRVAIVTKASPQQVTVVLSSGDVLQITGKGLRQAMPGLQAKAKPNLRIERGSVVRVVKQAGAWRITQMPEADGALVALNPHSGDVEALVGGFDFRRNQFNHVTQGWRQPGSSFKPFLYSAALEKGVTPETLVNDAPLTDVGTWNPSNADGSADGPITVKEGLTKSKNLVSIRLVQLVGATAARDWTAQFGFDADKQPDNLTLALGTGSTTPLQLASAYAVLANGGLKTSPVVIRKVINGEGKVVFEAPVTKPDESQRAIPARNAYLTSTLLNEVTRVGTAARAQATLKRPDLYGKTGTTTDVVDAWFAGFQPDLVAVVWLGYDTPRSLGSHSSGASLALPAWIQFMGQALAGKPVHDLAVPEGLVQVDGHWRYSEWADGGYIEELGMNGQSVSPALIPTPPDPNAPKDVLGDAIKKLINKIF
ncbi:penicillin-binding protein 1A [Aquabacterium sp.]|uniref:penicillin-binding protein 1A n=1 Tax=Aquabacterium sp. TaxID=1872578 RepID=UPI0035B3AFDF